MVIEAAEKTEVAAMKLVKALGRHRNVATVLHKVQDEMTFLRKN